MTRLRVFVAATAAACGLFTMIGTPAANAAIINIEVGEGGPPSAPPPPGGLLSLCLQIRPNPASCIAL